jgi:hypothetical protein
MALTDTAIRGAKPGTKPFKLYDREGLFLLINPSGSKLWRWRYKFDGKEKLMALGEGDSRLHDCVPQGLCSVQPCCRDARIHRDAAEVDFYFL